MYGLDLRRAGRLVAIGTTLLAGACGGDGGATGPGGGGSLTGTYFLVGVNDEAVPAVAQMERCTPSAFTAGSLIVDAEGNWRFGIELEDETGRHVLEDNGRLRRDGDELAFSSARYGDRFEGETEEDLIVLYYDFCANGEHDVDFVFER
jgi:hypothetical protein